MKKIFKKFFSFLKEKRKRKILLFSFFTLTTFYTFLLSLGMISGYLISRFFSGKKEGEKGLIQNPFILKFKNYKLYLHHWLIGFLIFFVVSFIDFSSLFIKGLILGITFQGIFDYNDWHKIIIKL